MRTGVLVFALTAAGAVGGIAAALLLQGGPTGPDPAPRAAPVPASPGADAETRRSLADLLNRVEGLEANLRMANEETARLRDALEVERKDGAAAREKLAALEEAGAAAANAFPGRAFRLGQPGEAQPQVALAALSGNLPERFRRMQELRSLPEEERWQKAREALGLTLYQEEELKAASKEHAESHREAMKITTQETKSAYGTSTQAISIAMPDMEKMREARKRYDDRVSQALNAEQAKKWREEGYEGALGAGGGGFFSTATRLEVHGTPEGK